MDLIRVLRILRHRWLTISAIVVATVAVAVATVTIRNNSIEPLSRAEAPVTYLTDVTALTDQPGLQEAVQAQIDDARTRAESVNAELLSDPRNEIQADANLGRLTFIARHPDPTQASATAGEMRNRFLTRQPPDMDDQIEAQLGSLSDQLDAVRADIDALDERNALPREVVARRDRLTTLLGELEAQALELERELLVPSQTVEGAEPRTPNTIQAELDEVNAAIAEVLAELETIPEPLAEFSVELTERRALERQYRELEAAYQELVLQRGELSGDPNPELVDVLDETPDMVSRRAAVAMALFLGGGLAFLVVLITERMTRPVWFPKDVPGLPFLATVPYRSPSPLPWYLQSGESPRKAAVQTLRSSLRARAKGTELIVGIAGDGVPQLAVQTLGADLAVSFASTAASTTLIDASFEDHPVIPEQSGASFTLLELASGGESVDRIQALVDEGSHHQDTVHERLMTIGHGDTPGIVPADALDGPQIGYLFEALRETRDVVVMVCGDVDTPVARAGLDRTDLALIVVRPGSTTQASLGRVTEELSVHHIDVAGVMVKVPTLPRLRRAVARFRSRSRPAPQPIEVTDEPAWLRRQVEGLRGLMARLRPTREDHEIVDTPAIASHPENGTGTTSEEELASVVRVVGPATNLEVEVPARADDDPERMIELLEAFDPADVSDRSEDFMVAWVTKLIEARPDSGLEASTLSEVRASGFVPLSTWKANPSLGSRLRQELRHSVGKKEAGRLEDLLLKSLSLATDPSDATSFDRWVGRRFFARHVVDTDYEPTVWHVTSARATVSALIAAERLDSARIEAFVDGVVIRAIERLARRQRRKELMGDRQPSELELQIEDARALGLAFAWLMDGSTEESRLWYPGVPRDKQPAGWNPDWSQGIKSNIAPLQRLGILAVPVLSEKELEVLDPTG